LNKEIPLSDSGSDADRRKWTHKRAQFDNAIHSARLLGFVQKLATGVANHREIVETLVQVNSSADQADYIAEILAIKKELRDLTQRDFHPEIAGFLVEASRLIPELTDGLASQIMMVLGHAGQNDAYLETVSDAVSGLLADLDHPLSADARSYLRLLWDQIEATRRLKQTEAQFTGPSMPLPSSVAPSERRDSGKLPKAQARVEEHPASEAAAAVSEPPVIVPSQEHAAGEAPLVASELQGSALTSEKASPPSSIPKAKIRSIAAPTPATDAQSTSPVTDTTPSPVVYESREETMPGYKTRPMPVRQQTTPDPVAAKSELERQVTLIQFAVSPGTVDSEGGVESSPIPRVPSVPPPDVLEKGWDDGSDELDADRQPRRSPGRIPIPQKTDSDDESDYKLPTRGVPRWALITAIVTVSVLVTAVVYLTKDDVTTPAEPATSASAKAKTTAPQMSATAKASTRPTKSSAKPAQSAAPPPPPVVPVAPPATPSPEPKPAPPVPPEPHANPAQKSPPGRVAMDAVNVPAAHPAKTEPTAAASTKPTPAATATQEPRRASATIVTPPDVAKNMSPLDRIIAELRIISPDPVGIEDKARELSRIIASSKRKDAFYIIDHLGPPVALDPLGRDPALEESLRTFAISTLSRVALDDDDSRAVSAVYMIGEWARSGGKGRQKAIAALDSLNKEKIFKTSSPRIKALRAVIARLDE
jgi:hypothetical protein